MKLLRIPPEQISQRWASISPFLASVLKSATDDFTLDQMKVYLTNGQWLTLGIFDGDVLKGVITISFTNMPNDRVAWVTAIGGKNITNLDTFSQLKAILKAHGATKIQAGVRESVARLWRRLNFKQRQILVEFKL
jgi:hypothetical protein